MLIVRHAQALLNHALTMPSELAAASYSDNTLQWVNSAHPCKIKLLPFPSLKAAGIRAVELGLHSMTFVSVALTMRSVEPVDAKL